MNEDFWSIDIRVEIIPTDQEVGEKFHRILAGREYIVLNKTEDADGPLIWEIESLDEDGDKMTMEYKRAGNTGNPLVDVTKIRTTLYFEGIPRGAGAQYTFDNGVWKMVP